MINISKKEALKILDESIKIYEFLAVNDSNTMGKEVVEAHKMAIEALRREVESEGK